MKLISAIIALLTVPLQAGTATLEWDRNDEPEAVGYRLYYGLSTGLYTFNVDAGGNTTATVATLTAGRTYFFAVTAYNTEGLESPYSNEVSFTAPQTPIVLAQTGTALHWTDARTAPQTPGILNYRVEWAGPDGTYVWGSNTTARAFTLPVLQAGRYTFRVVPVGADGTRGEPSNVLAVMIPEAPKGLRIKVSLQISRDLQKWETPFSQVFDDEKLFVRAIAEPQ